MKTLTLKKTPFALALAASIGIVACKKDAVTKPVYFTETTYETLPYDSTSAKPKNLSNETVSTELTNYITSELPERGDIRTVNPDLLKSNTSTDLKITQQSDVWLTFVSRGTKYKNTIGFYTYPTNTPPQTPADIKKITYVFPNAGAGSLLKPGDKVKIGTFNSGTSIGLVLLKDAWNPTLGVVDSKAVHFCYNDALNPEIDPNLKKHVVLIDYPSENKILIGFEDIDRTSSECDHDFNDVVIYATIK